MSAFTRSVVRFTRISAFGLGTLLGRDALAQPNPFDDYDRFSTAGPATATAPAPAVPVGPTLKTAPMTWSLGARSQLGFSRLTYERGNGAPDGAATTVLFRLSPALQLFVHERIQIGLSPGLMVRAGGNNIGDDAADANMLIEATVHYFAPLSPRFSFVPGLGLGGYFGSGSRTIEDVTPDGGTTRESRGSKTSGLSLALALGFAYQLDDHLQVRSGLSANAFLGWDSIKGRSGRVENSGVHIGIPIELFYVF